MTKDSSLFLLLAAVVPSVVLFAGWHLAKFLDEGKDGPTLDDCDLSKGIDRSHIFLASRHGWNDPD